MFTEAWTRTNKRLRTELGEDIFTSWFARIELVGIKDGVASISVPTKFLKSWIGAHYVDRILRALGCEMTGIERLVIDVRTNGTMLCSAKTAAVLASPTFVTTRTPVHQPREAPVATIHLLSPRGSPLNPNCAFGNFFVGTSNHLAYAACWKVATAGDSHFKLPNPIFIYGKTGLGKTHLLQAISHSANSEWRTLYLTAEKFMLTFVSGSSGINFKDILRGVDVLIIDDMQFLQGKKGQEVFAYVLDWCIENGRQMVIGANLPPHELEKLDERVLSRLAGGLCVEIGPLDEASRFKILQAHIAAAKSAHPGFDVSTPVVAYIAKVIQTNGRDLDGAINRLFAHFTLTRTPLTVEVTEVALRDLIRARDPKRVKIEDIQKLVATHYNVSKTDIMSSRRTATIVRPRQIAMYLSKILTLRSLPEIGRRFGGRDHTTVLHAVRKIDGLVGKDGTLSEEIELFKRMLLE